jgi:hypothetical protein
MFLKEGEHGRDIGACSGMKVSMAEIFGHVLEGRVGEKKLET